MELRYFSRKYLNGVFMYLNWTSQRRGDSKLSYDFFAVHIEKNTQEIKYIFSNYRKKEIILKSTIIYSYMNKNIVILLQRY